MESRGRIFEFTVGAFDRQSRFAFSESVVVNTKKGLRLQTQYGIYKANTGFASEKPLNCAAGIDVQAD